MPLFGSHVCPFGQVPQSTTQPQPSDMIPHAWPAWAQVFGMQPPAVGSHAHTFGVPPTPQSCPAVQVPQSRTPPQPSPAMPQL
jgi:hypothetical protein